MCFVRRARKSEVPVKIEFFFNLKNATERSSKVIDQVDQVWSSWSSLIKFDQVWSSLIKFDQVLIKFWSSLIKFWSSFDQFWKRKQKTWCASLFGGFRMLDFLSFPSWPKWRDFGHLWPKSRHFGHDGKKKKNQACEFLRGRQTITYFIDFLRVFKEGN